jgi:hypothetical protein
MARGGFSPIPPGSQKRWDGLRDAHFYILYSVFGFLFSSPNLGHLCNLWLPILFPKSRQSLAVFSSEKKVRGPSFVGGLVPCRWDRGSPWNGENLFP